MQSILEKLYYQNNLKSWGISILIIISSFVVARICFWVIRTFAKRLTEKTTVKFDDLIINALEGPIIGGIIASGIYLGLYRLKIGQKFFDFVKHSYLAFITILAAWFLVRVTDKFFDEYITPLVEKSENDLDDQLLPIFKKGLIIGTWVLGGIVALNNAGFNVGALIAGMGIGGLAFAMAAKDTVSNFFGGITVFADRPFKLGDRVKVSGFEGFIEEVGIRSTRLRTLEGREITIPNAKFIDGIIENVSREPSRKMNITLGLTYDTSHQKISEAQAILKEIVANDSRTSEKVLTSFSSFGDSSLNVQLIYYINKDEDILQTSNDINIAILEKFNQSGLSFAFPTITIQQDLPAQ